MDQPLGRLVPGGQAGGLVGQFRQPRFDRTQGGGRLVGRRRRVAGAVVVALARLQKLRALPLQPLDHAGRVAVQRRLALDVAVQLGHARGQRVDRLCRPCLGLVQRLAFYLRPRQDRGRHGFLVAQRRQRGFRAGPVPGGAAGGGFGAGRQRAGLFARVGRGAAGKVGR